MNNIEIYMQRCLELAKNGLGNVSPNPLVGCVIVHNKQIIGEGYHRQYGETHAEVNAINSVKDKSLLPDAEIYINLEPCSHYGKTPPCCDLIIEHGIKKVFIGSNDSSQEVSGKGIEKLIAAGHNIKTGVLHEEAIGINRRFYTYHKHRRPYIILKWAKTLDGFIDKIRDYENEKAARISNEISRSLVHKWRSEEDAIIVGTNTAVRDNPQLNVRDWSGKNPLRIVLDRDLRLPDSLRVFKDGQSTVVYTAQEKTDTDDIEYAKINFDEHLVKNIIADLYNRNIQSVIVEGGKMLLDAFIDSNMWDEARVLVGNNTFGDGIPTPVIKLPTVCIEDIDDNKLLTYRNSTT
ncbi:MAG: bifunctional diaminohydroxyphosphoribosylaminopyrimidine deaminase/5-amino-6-(5-phosphoribosylamino)uracil reductase RibD [Flavobacteriales bacterium]|nr:bifunctional diaminohydroxyphosphoribosylaminopyrimidine deaminase/5-amino-6-(5-phosphoribosylamino)uracil reductase RibD [Flavobacteriales bacterium]